MPGRGRIVCTKAGLAEGNVNANAGLESIHRPDHAPCLCNNTRMKTKRNSGMLLSELAYAAVRDEISKNTLKPGDRVSEYEVAERLKMSRTPAREGLRKLENEGLLEAHPRRGLVVASINNDAVYEMYDVRKILEGAVSAMAARRASDADIAALLHLADSEALIADDPGKMYEHNCMFHDLIYMAAHNRYLLKFLRSIRESLIAQRNISTMVTKERRDEVLREHRALVDAIARHDEEAAKDIAVQHIEGAARARAAMHRDKLIAEVERRASTFS